MLPGLRIGRIDSHSQKYSKHTVYFTNSVLLSSDHSQAVVVAVVATVANPRSSNNAAIPTAQIYPYTMNNAFTSVISNVGTVRLTNPVSRLATKNMISPYELTFSKTTGT